MALTFRTTKGSALTIEELDANFEYFTGSHTVTGSLTTSGSLIITGSTTITGSVNIIGSTTITGSLVVSSSVEASSFSGSYFILPVLDTVPSDTPPNGTIKLFSSASVNYIYAYLSGSWVSASLV